MKSWARRHLASKYAGAIRIRAEHERFLGGITSNLRRLRLEETSVKRTFLKLCSAAMTSRALSPLSAWSSSSDLTNWAGNFEYSTDKQHSATSMNDIQEFVKRRSSLKVLSTRHCFNKIADSTSEFLSLRAMNRVVSLDPVARAVTVESGMSYGQLCPCLDSQGWALHNLASLPHISIAGACSTGTHGPEKRMATCPRRFQPLKWLMQPAK
jgi:FAD binding domain